MDIKSAQINQALGVFVLFFGCVVLYATTYTNTSVGFNTNLVAGLPLSSRIWHVAKGKI